MDIELSPPSDATAALAWHATEPELLAAAGWDANVRLYDVTKPDIRAAFPHPGPVLDIAFPGRNGPNGKLFSGGLDRNLRELDISTGQQTMLGTHADAIKSLVWLDNANALLSGGWDEYLRLTDLRVGGSGPPAASSKLPAKCYSIDAVDHRVVVATGQRHIWIYDDRNMTEPEQKRESSLRFMTRTVRISPTNEAYVVSSIEGRVAVEFFDQSDEAQKRKYAFKSHRQTEGGNDVVYPVNAVAFHPVHHTFVTGGGDGFASIWDLSAKKRLRQLPKYPASVSALDFSCDGARLAVAASVIEEEGTAKDARNGIFVRTVGDECKPKSK